MAILTVENLPVRTTPLVNLPDSLPTGRDDNMATAPSQPAPSSEAANVASAPSASPLVGGMPKIIRFEALARCGDEIWIENDGQIYRLRRTRQGKLILTK